MAEWLLELIGRSVGAAPRYVLESYIGGGGMGHVFAARREASQERVAIKILHREHSADPDLRKRFDREAKAARLVRHPNITALIDKGTESDGMQWIAFELLHGESLHARLRREPLSLFDVAYIVDDTLQGIGAAHRHGLVHRDIKPANLFLPTAQRTVKVMDFGIAKAVKSGGLLTTSPLTAVGMALGTPAYMSPEQFDDARTVGPVADTYAVGVVAYECLSGRLPFEGANPVAMISFKNTNGPYTLEYVTHDERARPLEEFLGRAMAFEPHHRYRTAAEMLDAWRALRRKGVLSSPEPLNRPVEGAEEFDGDSQDTAREGPPRSRRD